MYFIRAYTNFLNRLLGLYVLIIFLNTGSDPVIDVFRVVSFCVLYGPAMLQQLGARATQYVIGPVDEPPPRVLNAESVTSDAYGYIFQCLFT